MTAPHPSPAPALPQPTPEQQRVLQRIQAQRALVQQRRAARRLQQAQAVATGARVNPDAPLPQRLLEFARLHPLLLSVLAAVSVVAGPKRVLRWGAWVMPWAAKLARKR